MTEAWKEWEGHVVDGLYSLRQYLGCGDKGVVYLTEYQSRPAAIKLTPESPADLPGVRLSHPHLLAIYQAGRCTVGDADLGYIVMEYAEENLSQVIPERALTPGEVRAMLPAALDALEHLHGNGLVHGGLKPANILAVNDQLKISTDGVRRSNPAHSPEQDIWLLGRTLAEALTRQAQAGDPVAPPSLPQPFLDIVRGCLDPEPHRRWTIAQIRAKLEPQPAGGRWRYLAPVLGLAICGVVIGSKLLERRPDTPAVPAAAVELPKAQPAPVAPAPSQSVAVRADAVRKVLPEVPAKAQSTITGRVRIRIRLSVDASGNVTDAKLDSPGASPYFANLALQAARQWKFGPAAARDAIVRFEFSRTGVTASL